LNSDAERENTRTKIREERAKKREQRPAENIKDNEEVQQRGKV
jgi:hypothetical protein